jgi:predicted transcriptional regulator
MVRDYKKVKTEFDKSILLGMLVLTKGSKEKFVDRKEITSKFARAKRKYIIGSLRKLVREGYIEKNPKEDKYKFTKEGLEEASKLLMEGAKLWYME